MESEMKRVKRAEKNMRLLFTEIKKMVDKADEEAQITGQQSEINKNWAEKRTIRLLHMEVM